MIEPQLRATHGLGRVLEALGRRECPDCRADLEPAGESSLACPVCDESWRVP